jgi:hypothetical protein
VTQNRVKSQQHDDEEAVAIVGSGMILPGATGQAAFREMLRSQENGIRPVPVKPWDARLFSDRLRFGDKAIDMPGAGVIENFEYDWKTHGIPPKQLAQASPLQFMILEAVDQALKEANYDVKDAMLRMTTGCIVGTSFGGDFATQLILGLRQPEICELLSRFLVQNGCVEIEVSKIVGEFQRIVLKHLPALIDETGSFTSSRPVLTSSSVWHKPQELTFISISSPRGSSRSTSSIEYKSPVFLITAAFIFIRTSHMFY